MTYTNKRIIINKIEIEILEITRVGQILDFERFSSKFVLFNTLKFKYSTLLQNVYSYRFMDEVYLLLLLLLLEK